MGADFIDYIIADKVVLPFEQQPYYAEKIVHLPDCFLVNDATKRDIADDAVARRRRACRSKASCSAASTTATRFRAEVFDVWMRLLAQVDGSVLWLLAARRSRLRQPARRSARRAASIPARIVFAPRSRPWPIISRVIGWPTCSSTRPATTPTPPRATRSGRAFRS